MEVSARVLRSPSETGHVERQEGERQQIQQSDEQNNNPLTVTDRVELSVEGVRLSQAQAAETSRRAENTNGYVQQAGNQENGVNSQDGAAASSILDIRV